MSLVGARILTGVASQIEVAQSIGQVLVRGTTKSGYLHVFLVERKDTSAQIAQWYAEWSAQIGRFFEGRGACRQT